MNDIPVIFYIDDDEAMIMEVTSTLPQEWQVHTYRNPLTALSELNDKKPWVVLSDQALPQLEGIKLLEMIRVQCPESIRVLITRLSTELTLRKSVQDAKIYDYIVKPWDDESEELQRRIAKAIEKYLDNRKIYTDLKVLSEENERLKKECESLALSLQEVSAYIQPTFLKAILSKKQHAAKGRFFGVVYDIINSSEYLGIVIEGSSVRNLISNRFTELVIKYGGFLETHIGDSAYSHFGLLDDVTDCNVILALTHEFRTSIRALSERYHVDVEVGIALHTADNVIQVERTLASTLDDGTTVKNKRYQTESPDVDLLFRVEKLVHSLPGSNIIITQDFYERLSERNQIKFSHLGTFKPKGQLKAVNLYIARSDKCSEDDLARFREVHAAEKAS